MPWTTATCMVVTNCMAVPAGELTYQLTSSAPIPWFFTSVLECQGQINVASVTWCKTLWKGKAWGESQGTNTSIRFMLIYLPFLCPPRQIFCSTCCNSNMWFGWKIGWERYTWAHKVLQKNYCITVHTHVRGIETGPLKFTKFFLIGNCQTTSSLIVFT